MFQLQWSQQTGIILMSLTILEMELGLSAPSESLDPARDAAVVSQRSDPRFQHGNWQGNILL